MYGATLEEARPWIENYEERLDGLASKFPGGDHTFLLKIPQHRDPNDRGYDAIRRLCLIEMSRVLPELVNEEADVVVE